MSYKMYWTTTVFTFAGENCVWFYSPCPAWRV